MDIDRQLKEYGAFAAQNDWRGLEAAAKARSRELAGADIMQRIESVNLEPYEKALVTALRSALRTAAKVNAPAIYFEYDMDNDWDGVMCVCGEYRKLPSRGAANDDWAADTIDERDVRSCTALAKFYDDSFNSTKQARGINGYLIARTIAAFGRACSQLELPEIAVCIGFHDQDRVTRIHEGPSRTRSGSISAEDGGSAKGARYFRWEIDVMSDHEAMMYEKFPHSRLVKVTNEQTGKVEKGSLSVLDEGVPLDPPKYKSVTGIINSGAKSIKAKVAEIEYGFYKVISKDVAAVIARELGETEHQLLPMEIRNNKGELLSRDYQILNSLRWVDCLDLNNTVMERIDKIAPRPLQYEIKLMCQWMLHRRIIPEDAALFRPEGCRNYYIVREDLAKKMISAGIPKHSFVPVTLS